MSTPDQQGPKGREPFAALEGMAEEQLLLFAGLTEQAQRVAELLSRVTEEHDQLTAELLKFQRTTEAIWRVDARQATRMGDVVTRAETALERLENSRRTIAGAFVAWRGQARSLLPPEIAAKIVAAAKLPAPKSKRAPGSGRRKRAG